MKIFNLLFEKDKEPYGHKLTPVSYDPETGAYSSKVEYTPLRKVKTRLKEMNDDLIDVVKDYPEDANLLKLQQEFESFKRSFNRYTNKVYGR